MAETWIVVECDMGKYRLRASAVESVYVGENRGVTIRMGSGKEHRIRDDFDFDDVMATVEGLRSGPLPSNTKVK